MEGKDNAGYSGDFETIKRKIESNENNTTGVSVTKGNEGSELVTVKGDPFQQYRISKQVLLVIIWICIGLAGEIVGPTLPDLKDRLGVNYAEASQVLIGKSVGMLVGSIIGGFINDRFYYHVDLIMVLGLTLMAAAAIATPFCRAVPLAATMFSLNGIAEGIINTGGNTMVMDLWGEDTAAPMHSLHFGFGLGALIAPQIARPFLSPDAIDDDDDISMTTTVSTMANSTISPAGDLSRIEIPFSIIGGLVLVFTLVLLAFYLKGPPKGFVKERKKMVFKDMISPGSCTGGHVTYGLELFICLFFYFIQAVGGERAYGKFLFSFAIESDLKMKKSDASVLQTVFWASFTAGRGLGVPLAKFVPVRYMMLGDIIGNLVVGIVLSLFAHREVLVLWIFTCLCGIFVSVMFPNGMAWANLRLTMNSMGVMVLMVGGSCGGFIYQYLGGHLFEIDPRNLMYVMVGFAAVNVVVFVVMETIAEVHGKRIRQFEMEPVEDTSDVVVYSVEKGMKE